jgi:hypothetical protein
MSAFDPKRTFGQKAGPNMRQTGLSKASVYRAGAEPPQ